MKRMKSYISCFGVILCLLFAMEANAVVGFQGATIINLNTSQQIFVGWNAIQFDTVEVDTDIIFDPLNNTRLTVPRNASLVKVCASASLDITTGEFEDFFHMRLYKNGSAYFNGNGEVQNYYNGGSNRYYPDLHACTAPIPVVEGDYFEVKYNAPTFTGSIRNSRSTWISMEILD